MYRIALIAALLMPCVACAESPETIVVICFTDPQTCPPCRAMEPLWDNQEIKEVMQDRGIKREVINPRRSFRDRVKYKVNSWPTTIAVKRRNDGQEVTIQRVVGGMSKETLKAFLKEVK